MMSTVIAIDLGGTKLSAALLDATGQVIHSCTEPTQNDGRAAILAQLTAVIGRLRQGQDVRAVGLGTPGFVDTPRGIVLLATNLTGWSQTEARTQLQETTGIATVVANDANAAAVGEAWLGAGRGKQSFVMLTLGTGVGGAIFDRRHGLWLGNNHRGGEFGHSIIHPGGRPCACGQLGCVDQYLSGRAIQRAYHELTDCATTCEQIFERAKAGEPAAQSVIGDFARDLAVHLISLQSIIDPEVFILGGGLLAAQSVWGELLDARLQQLTVPGMGVCWRPAETGALAGLLGAGRMAWDLVEQTDA